MDTKEKVKRVLALMGTLGAVKDGGMCGARGRTVLVLGEGQVKVGAVFYRDWHRKGAYKIQFSIDFNGGTVPAQITSAAWNLAKVQDRVPVFTPEEAIAVMELLEEEFPTQKAVRL